MAMEDSPLAACSYTTSPGHKQGGRCREWAGFHCALRLCNLVQAVYLCNPIRHDCSKNSLGAAIDPWIWSLWTVYSNHQCILWRAYLTFKILLLLCYQFMELPAKQKLHNYPLSIGWEWEPGTETDLFIFMVYLWNLWLKVIQGLGEVFGINLFVLLEGYLSSV